MGRKERKRNLVSARVRVNWRSCKQMGNMQKLFISVAKHAQVRVEVTLRAACTWAEEEGKCVLSACMGTCAM